MSTTPAAHEIPIMKMVDSLSAVHRYCAASEDPAVAVRGAAWDVGQSESLCIVMAAEMAHWIATQVQLMAKTKLHVTCPMWVTDRMDEFDVQCLSDGLGPAVAMLLGRDPESIYIEFPEMTLQDLDGLAPEDGYNGIWNKNSLPGQQMSDAIWLRDIDAESLLQVFCFSDDLGKAVFEKVPVGISNAGEIELEKTLCILRLTGYFIGAVPLKNKLNCLGQPWDAYLHSDDCIFADTSSYIVSITGQLDEALGSKELRERLSKGKEILEIIEGAADFGVNALQSGETVAWTVWPGTILKCRFDSDRNERYQVLNLDWMVRMSDGAVLRIGEDQDIRGEEVMRLTNLTMGSHPGMSANWAHRAAWSSDVLEEHNAFLDGDGF